MISLINNFAKLIANCEFVKFCLVGLSGVVVSLSSLWFLTEVLNLFYAVSAAIATILAISNNF